MRAGGSEWTLPTGAGAGSTGVCVCVGGRGRRWGKKRMQSYASSALRPERNLTLLCSTFKYGIVPSHIPSHALCVLCIAVRTPCNLYHIICMCAYCITEIYMGQEFCVTV